MSLIDLVNSIIDCTGEGGRSFICNPYASSIFFDYSMNGRDSSV